MKFGFNNGYILEEYYYYEREDAGECQYPGEGVSKKRNGACKGEQKGIDPFSLKAVSALAGHSRERFNFEVLPATNLRGKRLIPEVRADPL